MNTEFDLEKLNEIFELLKLESNSDLSNASHILDNKSKNNHLIASDNGAEKSISYENKSQKFDNIENEFKKNIKIEYDEHILSEEFSFKVSLNEDKVPLALIKKEIEGKDHFAKYESLTDSSSDEENYTTLIKRGPEKNKKKHYNETVYERRVPVSSAAFDIPKFGNYDNSDPILRNNSNASQVRTSLPSKFPVGARQVELSCSPESLYVYSPDSGYGSPSQPIVSPPSQPIASPSYVVSPVPLIASPSSHVFSSLAPIASPSPCAVLPSVPIASLSSHVVPPSPLTINPSSHDVSPLPPITSPSAPIVDSVLPFGDEHNDEERRKLELIYSFMEAEEQFRERKKLQQTSTMTDSHRNDIEQLVEKRQDPSDSMRANIAGDLKNEYTSLEDVLSHLLITNSSFQAPDEVSDELWNVICNDLYNSTFSSSTSATTVTCLENYKCKTDKFPVRCYKTVRQVERDDQKISYQIKDGAKKALRNSESFDVEKYVDESKNILTKIKCLEKSKEKVKIIDYDEREKYKNLNQTNLHSAVIESNVEKVLCIIEALKRYDLALFDINNRDANKKTALDYAIKKNMPLLINYLKENNAVPTISI